MKDKNSEINNDNKNVSSEVENFPTVLQKAVNTIVKKEGYEVFNTERKNVTTGGGSYLATLYEVNIEGKTSKGDQKTYLFIKHIIPETGPTLLSISEAYNKESLFYNELTQAYNEHQDEANVPEQERLKVIKSYDETNNEAIIMENMAKKGFKTWNRTEIVNLKFEELSLQQLARCHGLSIVLQKKRPDFYTKKVKHLKHHLNFNEHFEKFIRNQCKTSVASLDEVYKKKVAAFIPKFLEKYPEYFTINPSLPGSTMCHGDLRPNNILYKEVNGEVEEIIPVDYQLIYHGCPLNDFFYLIFTSTDQDFRKNHLGYLKNFYYDSLEKFLMYFDLNMDEIYPREEFERQYKERLDYGLMVALYGLPFCLTSEDQVPALGEDDMTNLTFAIDDRGYERIKGILDDYIEWGYL